MAATRAEHLQWCKDRALEYADRGDTADAIASMTSDLGKHPETKNHVGIYLLTIMAATGALDRPGALRHEIEGFQ